MNTETRKKWLLVVVLIIIVVMALGFIVLILRGDEDTWIKDTNGNWVKHGNPSASAPPD